MDAHGNSRTGDDLTRREALGAASVITAGAALAGVPLLNRGAQARAARKPLARDGEFPLGVAAGIPMPYRIPLWTHIEGLERSSRVEVEVAKDPDFRKVVARRKAVARRKHNFNVNAEIGRLKPSTEYWYRFSTRETSSRVGRFRTAPPYKSDQPVKIGFFSCQRYTSGYFNALEMLAAEDDLDLVVCLGDYIYETGGDNVRTDTTGDNGDGITELLREYREKYALYRSDPALAAMHAAHPFVAIWDDHEVENNHAGDQPGSDTEPGETNGGTPRRVSYKRRRRNAYHAFFEAMPRKRIKGFPNRIYDRIRLGRMAEIFLLDERQYRDPQPCNDEQIVVCDTRDQPRAFLGREQMNWLKTGLSDTRAQWKVLGNQLMLMGLDIAPGVTATVDSWDGYGAERRELLNHVVNSGIDNLVTVTGDIHTFFAGTTTTDGRITGRPAGTEFVGGSITSYGLDETLGYPPGIEAIEAGALGVNPHMVYTDFEARGYGVLELSKGEARCRFMSPSTALQQNYEPQKLAEFTVAAGSTRVQQVA